MSQSVQSKNRFQLSFHRYSLEKKFIQSFIQIHKGRSLHQLVRNKFVTVLMDYVTNFGFTTRHYLYPNIKLLRIKLWVKYFVHIFLTLAQNYYIFGFMKKEKIKKLLLLILLNRSVTLELSDEIFASFSEYKWLCWYFFSNVDHSESFLNNLRITWCNFKDQKH